MNEVQPESPNDNLLSAPDWGCAEFRETIAWMRARWPELAAEAEHPILEAMLAAELAGDRRRVEQLRPSGWFAKRHRALQQDLLQTPLVARQMAAIEMGFAASAARFSMEHFSPFWGGVLLTGVLQALICIMIVIDSLNTLSQGGWEWFDWELLLIFLLGSAGGCMQVYAATKQRTQDYRMIRQSYIRVKEAIQGAAGALVVSAKTDSCLLAGCCGLTILITAPISFPFLLVSWLFIANLLSLIGGFGAKPADDSRQMMDACWVHYQQLQESYDKLAAKLASEPSVG